MTDVPSSDPQDSVDALPADESPNLPTDLPPVEPPSAGMIIQLFLVPAIIVAVIVGVYALFGRLASQELDWRQLVTDVKSENPHVRWRGALGLAQMLDADRQRAERGQQLSSNPEIANALATLYEEFIDLEDLSEEELKNLEFLSKALGRMSVSEEILPVFRSGMAKGRDREVRKHSLIGLSMLLGNLRDAKIDVEQPELVQELISISKEGDPLFRHQSAYALGLFDTEASRQRLSALLDDPELMTSVNAAIGFARNDSLEGYQTLVGLVDEAIRWKLDPKSVKTEEAEARYFEKRLMISNGLRALSQLQPNLSAEQKQELVASLDKLVDVTKDYEVQSQALELKSSLSTS